MLKQTLTTLAGIAPNSGFAVAFEIAALEKSLGLPLGRPTFNGAKAKARLAELQAQVAAKSATAPVAAPVAAVAPSPEVDAAVRIQRLEAKHSLPVTPLCDLFDTDKAAARLGEIEKLAVGPELRGLERAAAAFRQSAAAETRKLSTVAAVAPAVAGSMTTPKLAALCEHVFGRPVTFDGDPQTRARCLARLHVAGVVVPGMEADPHPTALTGFARTFAASCQVKANQFLSANPK